ncbi:MAG: TonB-dependent receptor [Mucilaginibacter sp.]|nr:TonB-dependent receptor [Mucilaginibacter sp.]
MLKACLFLILLLPAVGLSQADTKLEARAGVFLDAAAIGNNAADQHHIWKEENDTTISEELITRLKNFERLHITEKVYLHFDKPCYAAGDTIYFKAYVTMGQRHRPSSLSGVLHVDLINNNNEVDRSIKLQIAGGVAWGDFALADSLPGGNYRVRAYTNWMRNEGDAAYFYQTIPIGSVIDHKISESNTRSTIIGTAKADMQFFPEGGKLINGIKSKVAFKAIGANGLGIEVKGEITDNENKNVATFVSAHLGMGYFYLTPVQGKTYKANLTYANGTKDTINLPRAENKGITLSINNDSPPNASVQIEANNPYYQENKNKDHTLLVYSAGVATTVNCKLDSPLIKLDILKRRMHTGVATVTLFSPAGEPLCERLIFVQNNDQLNLAVSSDKTTYRKREKVNIKLNVKDRAGNPSTGHFSVAVIDESKVQPDENTESTILANLLLSSDLKGYIEQPNYYFVSITDKTNSDLDLVMLTNGFRRFEWKQVLNNTYPDIAYQPEPGLEIAGTAKSFSGKPLANAAVSLIAVPGGLFTSTLTDNKGRFRFGKLVFSNTTKFMLQAVNAKGRNTTTLFYDQDTPGPAVFTNAVSKLMPAYADNSVRLASANQYGALKGKALKEVVVTDKKIMHYPSNGNLISPEMADQLVTSEDIEKIGGASLKERILEKFYGRARAAGLIVVDGMSMPPGFNINNLNASEIETVAAAYGANAAIYGGRAAGGFWLITTKKEKGLNPKDIVSIGILPIVPKGFYKAREFYSPKYDIPTQASSRPDLRSTIYWNPELVTGNSGTASFEYYNADGTGSYRIVIEGIDDKGNLGRYVYRYKVE